MRLLALLLLLPSLAQGAITVVSSDHCSHSAASGAASCQVNLTSAQEDDVALVMFGGVHVSGSSITLIEPTSLTDVAEEEESSGNARGMYVGYEILGSSPPSTYTIQQNGATTGNRVSGAVVILRGADTTTQLDVTYVKGSHFGESENTLNLNAPDITTTTDGAWVFTAFVGSHAEYSTIVAPTNYTVQESYVGGRENYGMAYREITTAGAETIGAWQNTGSVSNNDVLGITVAVRPAAAGNSTAAIRRAREW